MEHYYSEGSNQLTSYDIEVSISGPEQLAYLLPGSPRMRAKIPIIKVQIFPYREKSIVWSGETLTQVKS